MANAERARAPTHMRPLTVAELDSVGDIVRERCGKERWISTYNGELLKPEQVTLYDLTHYLILPSCVPDGVELIGITLRDLQPGVELIQIRQSEFYAKGMRKVVARGRVISISNAAIAVQMIEGRFRAETDDPWDVWDRTVHVEGKMTQCGIPSEVRLRGPTYSYFELVAGDASVYGRSPT